MHTNNSAAKSEKTDKPTGASMSHALKWFQNLPSNLNSVLGCRFKSFFSDKSEKKDKIQFGFGFDLKGSEVCGRA
jgi:hypothetical protein